MPVSRSPGLPWLTPYQNAARRTLDRRLDELRCRPGIPPNSMEDLSAVSRRVDQVEQGVLEARALLQRSQTELLSGSEWRQLSSLVSSLRNHRPAWEAELVDRLARSAENGVPGSTIERMSHELQHRLAAVRARLSSNDLPWDSAVTRVQTILPVYRQRLLVADCRVVPGTALGAHFLHGYPGNDRDNLYYPERYSHVPGLALMTAADGTGRTLFSGLRHGLIHAGELDGEFLARLSDAELKTMVGALLFGETCDEDQDGDVTWLIDEQCRKTRASPGDAALQATALRYAACRNMACETAAAALVADPEKFQRALAGEPVDLTLCSIALLEPGEVETWCNQAEAFTELDQGGPVGLRVCSADGTPRTVRANVKVRQFVLLPEEENCRFRSLIYSDAVRLFGYGHTQDLGGDVMTRVNAMNGHVRQLREEILALERAYAQCSTERGAQHPEAIAMSGRLAELGDARVRLEQNARSLEEAGEQLKAMWAEEGRREWPAGADVYKQVAPKLALLSHLMGETPALSCRTGNRHIDQVQPEVMFVATVTDHLDGYVPPVDLETAEWEQVREDFTNRQPPPEQVG